MSDAPWKFVPSSLHGSSLPSSVNFIFRLLWLIESMWIVVVPGICAVSSVAVYRKTKSPYYSLLTTVCCGVLWLTSRYFILGRVPHFLTPQYKECANVVRVLLHNVRTLLKEKYSYKYPLIVNLGVLLRYFSTREYEHEDDCQIDANLAYKLRRYMDFSAASYGVLFYPKHAKSSFQRILASTRNNIGSFTTTVSVNVISEMTGITPNKIVMTQLKGENPLRPGYYICVDDATRSIVLVIRGTLTLSDALTDITCLNKEFLGGIAHHGISVSAEAIYDEIRVILEKQLEHTGYDLVMCGHSLGAGTAVLLTLYLLENRDKLSGVLRNVDISCYAYAPPPVFNIAGERPAIWKEKIITVVNGTDIIPRASLANAYTLLLQMQYVEKLEVSLWERCSLIMEKKTDRLELLMEGLDDYLEQTRSTRRDEVFSRLSHVGRVLWIKRLPRGSAKGAVLLKQSTGEWEKSFIDFRMLADHWPHDYQKTLERFIHDESSESAS